MSEWLEWAEQIGLGELGLMPDAFWSLTKREFDIKWDAFHRAEERQKWLVGKLALLTTQYERKPTTPDQLFGYVMMRYPVQTWLRRKEMPDDRSED